MIVGGVFLAVCLAFTAWLIVGELHWQATRSDRFDVMGDDDE